jgi:CubicO group peptidase (beta-lactamase class C family)
MKWRTITIIFLALLIVGGTLALVVAFVPPSALIGVVGLTLVDRAIRTYARRKPKTDAQIIALLDKCVVQQRRAPGMVIGIIDDKGAKVFAKGVRENGQSAPVDGDTLFEIGSVTKVFTALLLQSMTDSGEVRLDDAIGQYLPTSVKTPTRKGKEITLAGLATHTSGLPRLPDNLDATNVKNPYVDYTVEKLYDALARLQLKRSWVLPVEYSNLGVGLLGHVLALRAGESYEELVTRRICNPLQMNSTRITLTPELKDRLAPGHGAAGDTVENWDFAVLAGCGALRSTANDLLKFLAANFGWTHSSLSQAMVAAQQPRHRIGFFRKIGLIWLIDTARGTIWHGGGTGGYCSYVGCKRRLRRAVVVLANSANGVHDIGQFLLGNRSAVKNFQPPKARNVAQVDPNIFDSYVGQYKFPIIRTTITVTREGRQLFARLTGQSRLEVFPESETDFFYRVVDAQLTFRKDATGAVTDVILHQNGRHQKAAKVAN